MRFRARIRLAPNGINIGYSRFSLAEFGNELTLSHSGTVVREVGSGNLFCNRQVLFASIVVSSLLSDQVRLVLSR